MKKTILLGCVAFLSITCFAQTKAKNSRMHTTVHTATINYSLLDRVVSQRDGENASNHNMLNASLKISAKRLKMVAGNNQDYLIDFFNQILQSANRSILSDSGIEENFMRILRNEDDAITYVLKYPTTDLEQEYKSGKSRLSPLTLY